MNACAAAPPAGADVGLGCSVLAEAWRLTGRPSCSSRLLSMSPQPCGPPGTEASLAVVKLMRCTPDICGDSCPLLWDAMAAAAAATACLLWAELGAEESALPG